MPIGWKKKEWRSLYGYTSLFAFSITQLSWVYFGAVIWARQHCSCLSQEVPTLKTHCIWSCESNSNNCNCQFPCCYFWYVSKSSSQFLWSPSESHFWTFEPSCSITPCCLTAHSQSWRKLGDAQSSTIKRSWWKPPTGSQHLIPSMIDSRYPHANKAHLCPGRLKQN